MATSEPIDNNNIDRQSSDDKDQEKSDHDSGQKSSTVKSISSYLTSHTHNVDDQDDLIDIRVGNPLDKITKLLEEIKKQKAFSFTLKGSLGIAGVALTISMFGIFGGGKIICDKGLTTEIGVLRSISFQEIEPYNVPLISELLNNIAPKRHRNRLILIKGNRDVIAVAPSGNIPTTRFINKNVSVTGGYNSCKKVLTVSEPFGIDFFE